MKIMYVTTALKAPNGVCAVNVIEELMKTGHKVSVFTQSNIAGEVRCPCQVIYSKHHSIHTKKERFKEQHPKSKLNKLIDFLYRVWIVLCYPIWPISSPLFVHNFAIEAHRKAKENDVDIIITEYGDIACLNAGRIVKNKENRIRVIAYFIDALYCGAKPSRMSIEAKNKKALHWENKMLADYDKVIMMEATKDRYSKIGDEILFEKKLTFLDIPMLKRLGLDEMTDNNHKLEDRIVFAYIGSMPRNIRNPKYLLELFKRINNPKWSLYIYGSNEYIDLIEDYKNYNVIYKGFVSHDVAISVLKEADYLINIGNSFPEMVPSKIFEYMSMGKPIISTFKIADDPCNHYLSFYANSICLDENTSFSDNQRRLVYFINDCRENGNIESFEELTLREGPLYKNTPKAFVECLEE
ncbi:MAG: glycosyltransferase family 4 protein [Lachnospiraceae bacterium]|jgi:glycosyltransferase involved in cell wall biosynthesis|nr:glycosyltransferase family 4 protein [Lachnospiraceae bacterium]